MAWACCLDPQPTACCTALAVIPSSCVSEASIEQDTVCRRRYRADSPNGLRQAIALASACGATLTVLDVVQSITSDDPELASHSEQLQSRLIADRSEALAASAGEGVEVPEIRVVAGKNIVEIVRDVEANAPDLVIKSAISSRLGHMIWGALDLK